MIIHNICTDLVKQKSEESRDGEHSRQDNYYSSG